jgi:hopanoid biosynthesis associated RND transporter like protein HpnN
MKPRPLSQIARLVRVSGRHPWAIIGAALVLCALAMVFIAGHFRMTSDTTALFSPKVAWRQHEIELTKAFPQNSDTIVVVVDGATPELAEHAASALFDKLSPDTLHFVGVRRPDGGPFFAKQGLLFLSEDEVRTTTDQLVSAQPFLGPMAADPSLRGVMSAISILATGVTQGQAYFDSVDKPIRALADSLQQVAAGKQTFFSWQALFGGDSKGGLQPGKRRFVIVQPKLNYGALTPGADASAGIRDAAKHLGLTPQHGVTIRLTGSTPLSDEEFASITDKAWLVFGSMGLAMVVMLWLAVRSARLVTAILITTLIGLVLTTAVGLMAIGRFSLISVAFIPLFVGLAVDFGIQLSVRYRAERLIHEDLRIALVAAGSSLGRSLVLAAAAITLGFFAFLPTPYVGVSELGIIAGFGMVIGLFMSLTLLPALIVLLKPPRQRGEVGSPHMKPLDEFLVRRRKLVLWGFAGSIVFSVALLPFVRFDFNPMHLRNPHGEAMATLLDISKDPKNTPNTLDVLRPSLADADQLAARLSKLPEVAQTVTLSSFVPDDQAPKLAVISDAQIVLDPTLNPLEMQPPPSDADNVQALAKTAADLRAAAAKTTGQTAQDALRLATALDSLAKGSPVLRARATDALVPPLTTMLDQIRSLLLAEPATLQSLPKDLARDWVTPDGRARVQVSPAGDSNDNKVLARFTAAVLKAAPDATGAPVSIQAASQTIYTAFITAGILSLVVISALLIMALRSLRETAFTLAPIVVAGFLTLATCVLINQPINFANIIAFPLLFGVGVAFHIYFVMAWRGGAINLLQSSLARGVFFSAMTTGMAFGSLMLSSHPGTASMGKILMISLLWTLVAALIFEPALLGSHEAHAHELKRGVEGVAPARARKPPPEA